MENRAYDRGAEKRSAQNAKRWVENIGPDILKCGEPFHHLPPLE